MSAGIRRERLRAELDAALRRAGATEAAIASVLADGCRLDGAGASAVGPELREASDRLQRRIRELAAALERLERGEYGRCTVCGGLIAEARLDLLPATRRCRRCTDGE